MEPSMQPGQCDAPETPPAAVPSWPTGMKLHAGEQWQLLPDLRYEPDETKPPDLVYVRYGTARDGTRHPVATLRRVGWLDQQGRVWTAMPPGAGFDGGSLTPLLIDAREDGY